MTQQDVGRRPGHRRREQDNLRRRLTYERQVRGWTVPELARRLGRVGVDLKAQDLYNMVSPSPGRAPRVVKVDELAGLAEVYDLTIEELLRPPEVALADEVLNALTDMGRYRRELLEAYAGFDTAMRTLIPIVPGVRLPVIVDRAADLERTLSGLIDVALDLEDDLRSGAVAAQPPRR